ncbi:hypothetical protein GDO78_008786 [Eleutherodactylus coqui]|uniref:Uncharacterized protein n=1 Tax=Eleutherodactylus coqui TaxID=57060 RepID=A0A8J6FCS4_ELECQ|nr:hypothetical protein GDO78_008786 [Eleutherodactylus coqui]
MTIVMFFFTCPFASKSLFFFLRISFLYCSLRFDSLFKPEVLLHLINARQEHFIFFTTLSYNKMWFYTLKKFLLNNTSSLRFSIGSTLL